MATPEVGTGQGQKFPRRGQGGRDLCICPKCKTIHRHIRGVPCTESHCSKCGATLIGYVGKE